MGLLAYLTAAAGICDAQAQLSRQPSLEIGGYSELLQFVRIVGATTLSDGSIVVADEGLSRIMRFSKAGSPLSTVGRSGRGPGEFQLLGWLGQCRPDSVHVYDPSQNRITVIDPAGRLSLTRPAMPLGPNGVPPSLGPSPYSLACGRGRGFVLVGWPSEMPPSRPGPHRERAGVAASRDGVSYQLLGTFPGPERYRHPKSDGPRPLGKGLHVAASPTAFFVGSADSFFVQVFDSLGRATRNIRWKGHRRPFARADRERLSEEWMRRLRTPAQRQITQKAIADMTFPDSLPAYERFLVDTDGNLWVQEAFATGDSLRRWSGFSPSSHPLGVLEVPENFDLLELSRREALGKWTDSTGNETVRRYGLVSAPRP